MGRAGRWRHSSVGDMVLNRSLIPLLLVLTPLISPAEVGYETKKRQIDDCPLCDSSVYSYCSNKLLHDACCCLNPYETTLPYQCQFADCSFLHANTCKEHHLITRCCCSY